MTLDLVNLVGTRIPRLAARFLPDVLWRMPHASERPCAYLTFDDGPSDSLTAPLLDLLARFDARATFFVLGRHAARDVGLVRAIHGAGHTIGNHSYTHPDPWRVPAATVLAELERTTGLLEDMVQAPLRWMRPPYGHLTRSMRAWCRVRRQRLTMWDLGPGDYLPSATPGRVARRILSNIRPGSIVVLHDNPKARGVTPQSLEEVLGRLTGEGWRFPTL